MNEGLPSVGRVNSSIRSERQRRKKKKEEKDSKSGGSHKVIFQSDFPGFKVGLFFYFIFLTIHRTMQVCNCARKASIHRHWRMAEQSELIHSARTCIDQSTNHSYSRVTPSLSTWP